MFTLFFISIVSNSFDHCSFYHNRSKYIFTPLAGVKKSELILNVDIGLNFKVM